MSETTALLEQGAPYSASSTGSEKPISARAELAIVSKASAPLILTFFLQYLMSVLSIYAAGRLGSKELAAASLAICSFNITGLSVYQGMATCLDLFCSQAFGAGKNHLVGVYFQRCSLILLTLTVFPLAPIWWFSGSLLKLVVPDAELAEMSQSFLRVMLFGAPGLLFFETGKRFLQAQHIYNAGTYVLAVSLPLSFVLNWLLVWHPTYGLGFMGAPLATLLSFWITSFLMLGYVVFVDGKRCWGGLDLKKAFSNWSPMLSLALPGVVMVEAEYLAFEVVTILAASFGTSALAAQSIVSNVGSLAFQLPFAVAVAVSTRIGHYVGKHEIDGARAVTRISFVLALGLSCFNFSFIFFGRHAIGHVFSQDPEVLDIANVVLTLSAINQISDSFNVMEQGILRGQGRQLIGLYLTLASYYLIGLPLGFVLALPGKLELPGVWIGLIAGVFFLAASQFACVYRSNWPRIFIDSAGRHDH